MSLLILKVSMYILIIEVSMYILIIDVGVIIVLSKKMAQCTVLSLFALIRKRASKTASINIIILPI